MTAASPQLRFAIYAPNFGTLGDPRRVTDLAHLAEQAGWHGWFTWDNLLWETDEPLADPWVTLAAVALATRRMRFGPLVTPLPRRRPWDVARATATLDHLSGGRLIFGAGLGGDWYRELSAFGEELDDKVRATMLDEGLDLLARLWSGEPVSFDGRHYHVDGVRFLPAPMQRPRIPIWIAGVWPYRRALARAARWDGVVPIAAEGLLPAADVRQVVAAVHAGREAAGRPEPFDVAVMGRLHDLPAARRGAAVASMAEAGATWWLESFAAGEPATAIERALEAGPPRG
ncbi:MAG: LLM class flavin-dependent oxidoreductase [Anaerolinea sp.]|nr:LLM class flavin-dependent oxidoreductase [Anaerolinea sp.]